MSDRPLLLLSNDDGVDAAGLEALRAAIEPLGDVIVCAPLLNQSASSHALTLGTVLRLKDFGGGRFGVMGTPADCVYVALHSGTRILWRRPDLVVSGMNHGPNLGVDTVYSGTVAAAREAAQRGIPAVAVSASSGADRAAAAAIGARVVKGLLESLDTIDTTRHHAPLLNVNVPPGEAWPLRATRLGRRIYEDEVIYRLDPRGREYMWIGGSSVSHDLDEGTDTAAWDAGEASVSPLGLSLQQPVDQPLAAAIADR